MLFRKAAWTANPVQTTAILGVEKGFRRNAVDTGNPLHYDDLPLVRALSLNWIEHLTTNQVVDQYDWMWGNPSRSP